MASAKSLPRPLGPTTPAAAAATFPLYAEPLSRLASGAQLSPADSLPSSFSIQGNPALAPSLYDLEVEQLALILAQQDLEARALAQAQAANVQLLMGAAAAAPTGAVRSGPAGLPGFGPGPNYFQSSYAAAQLQAQAQAPGLYAAPGYMHGMGAGAAAAARLPYVPQQSLVYGGGHVGGNGQRGGPRGVHLGSDTGYGGAFFSGDGR